MWFLRIGNALNYCIFTSVFHRILDFKNGAGFLSWPLIFLDPLCLLRLFKISFYNLRF
jgi:hypothetical protein